VLGAGSFAVALPLLCAYGRKLVIDATLVFAVGRLIGLSPFLLTFLKATAAVGLSGASRVADAPGDGLYGETSGVAGVASRSSLSINEARSSVA
jgi:hypothetical protein